MRKLTGELSKRAERTAAVLGCGVDICYPASNAALRRRIAERGLILSEYEPGTPRALIGFRRETESSAASVKPSS